MSQRSMEVVKRLKERYEFKEKKGWLREGICPVCKKHELFTNIKNPWVIKCQTYNKCGAVLEAEELYPDLWENFNERCQPTESNPNATADAYLKEARGFDIKKLTGFYTQEKYWNSNLVGNKKGTYTVRFYLNEEKTIYWERFVETVTVKNPKTGESKERKSRAHGERKGLWWMPPGMEIKDGDTVWITEAIIDAIALWINGIKAVSTLSSQTYTDVSFAQHKSKKVTWVWALDNDKAGKHYTIEHARRMEKEGYTVAAAQAPDKSKADWNDLHKARRFNEASIKEYLYNGDLLLAKTSTGKARLINAFTKRQKFFFDLFNRMYWADINQKDIDDKKTELREEDEGKENGLQRTEEEIEIEAFKQASKIFEIANCNVEFLYHQINTVIDESQYYCEVSFPHQGDSVKATFNSKQLTSVDAFMARLLHVGTGASFDGNKAQLAKIRKEKTYALKQVITQNYIGYNKEHGCYVFNSIAFRDGQLFEINQQDYFDMDKLAIKYTGQSLNLDINKNLGQFNSMWINHLITCYSYKAIVTLAGWFGSLFAEQIRAKHKSFPFMQVRGVPGSGKSTVIEFLWKLFGRYEYEGVNPNKGTNAGFLRSLMQTSNMPSVLLEGDPSEDQKHKAKRFDPNELKDLYNGRGIASRGVKNDGNETDEPPFKGIIVIAQNAAIIADLAVQERIIDLPYTKAGQNDETKRRSEELENWPMDQLSGFIVLALQKEKEILELFFKQTKKYEVFLNSLPVINNYRIAKNHAQFMALVDALALVIPISDADIKNTHGYIGDMAIHRKKSLNKDHEYVEQFFDVVEYINGDKDNQMVNHSRTAGVLALNLNHIERIASEQRQSLPDMKELKRMLVSSKKFKYKGQKAIDSALYNSNNQISKYHVKTVKCWIFEDTTFTPE